MKVIIQDNSHSFAIVFEKPIVVKTTDVPILLSYNFRTKAEYQSLTPEAQKFMEVIDKRNDFILFASFRFGERVIVPHYTEHAFTSEGRIAAQILIESIAEAFNTSVQVVIKRGQRLPAGVLESFRVLPGAKVQ